MRKKNVRWLRIAVLFALIIYIVTGFAKTGLVLCTYDYQSNKVPKNFDAFKIILISDLHHKEFGEHQKELITMIQEQNPDMIALTGDIVDKNHSNMESVEDFIDGIDGIAPIYYVAGNHELDPEATVNYSKLTALLRDHNIEILHNKTVTITRGEDVIYVTGVKYCGTQVKETIPHIDTSKFNILLYHASSAFDEISDMGYDVVLSGHGHGGVIRLPFVGGMIGNDKNLFPKYDGGAFIKNGTTLFSSRGLGDTKIPRFYNPPEVVMIVLRSE